VKKICKMEKLTYNTAIIFLPKIGSFSSFSFSINNI